MFSDEIPEFIPYRALLYLTGECNYGGQVRDDKDRRLVMTPLADYFNPDVLEAGHAYAGEPQYWSLNHGDTYDAYLEAISKLPAITPPSVFGFHQNANLTKEQGETYSMMEEYRTCFR